MKTNALDYATFDHVVELRRGGRNAFRNMVMACSFCNGYRDKLDLAAEDYYYWVVANRHALEKARAMKIAKARERQRLRTPPTTGRAQQRKAAERLRRGQREQKPLYDYL